VLQNHELLLATYSPLHLFLEMLLLAGTAMDIYLCVRMLFSYMYASVVNFACAVRGRPLLLTQSRLDTIYGG
jgi:hypothetical protein